MECRVFKQFLPLSEVFFPGKIHELHFMSIQVIFSHIYRFMHLPSTLLAEVSDEFINLKNYCSNNNFRNHKSIGITRKLNNHFYFNIFSPAHKKFSGSASQIFFLVKGQQVALS